MHAHDKGWDSNRHGCGGFPMNGFGETKRKGAMQRMGQVFVYEHPWSEPPPHRVFSRGQVPGVSGRGLGQEGLPAGASGGNGQVPQERSQKGEVLRLGSTFLGGWFLQPLFFKYIRWFLSLKLK